MPLFLGLSLGVHLGALLSLPSRVPEDPVVIEIVRGPRSRGGGPAARGDSVGEGSGQRSPADRVRLPVVAESRASSALDSGEPGASEAAGGAISVLLADRDQDITIAEQLPNNFAVTQFQRIATARDRSSLIDDRLTPNPADDTLLLSGRGRTRDMMPARAANGAVGIFEEPETLRAAPSGGSRSPAGAGDGGLPRWSGDHGPMSGLANEPPPSPSGRALEPELQRGVANGTRTGSAEAQGAAVVHARPDLHPGRPATPSEDRQGRLRDNRWSQLLVSTFNHGWVTASDPGGGQGEASGAGSGGRGAGRSGRGNGGRSAAGAGAGDETWISLNSPDPRFMAFFRDIHRKVDPLWRDAFPRDAELGLEQGTCIIGFTVHRDGHVSGIHVRRRSGFPEFDRRVQEALRRAAPFRPIPSSLGVDRLLVTAPFEFSNPMVR